MLKRFLSIMRFTLRKHKVDTRHRIDDHLSLVMPVGWQVWEPSAEVLFVGAAPEIGRDEIQPHFFVSRSPAKHDSSKDFLAGNVIYLQNHQSGYVEREIREFEVNGQPVGSLTYDAPLSNCVFTNKQYFLVYDDWAYLMTCKMLPEQTSRWSDQFDNIVKSIELS